MLDLFNWRHGVGSTLSIKVTPKASANRIKVETQSDGSLLYRVYVTVAAEDGKANAAVIALIAKELGIAKSKVSIVRGHTSRDKIIKIAQD